MRDSLGSGHRFRLRYYQRLVTRSTRPHATRASAVPPSGDKLHCNIFNHDVIINRAGTINCSVQES